MDIKVQNKKGEIDIAMLEELMAKMGTGQIAGSDLKIETKDLAALGLGSNGLTLTDVPKNKMPGTVPVATGLNELDKPDSEAAKMFKLERSTSFGGMLEQIIDLLLNENQRTGTKTNLDRIKSMVAKMKVDHQAVLRNLQKSLDFNKEVSRMQDRMKAFGWISAIFMAIVAVASLAAAIATAGGALAIGAAAIGVLGSAVGIVQQGVQGVIERDAEKYADKKIKEYGDKNVKDEDRKSRSELIAEYTKACSTVFTVISSVLAVAGLVVGVAAIRAAVKAAKEVAEQAMKRAAEMLKDQGKDATEAVVKNLAKSLEGEIAKELAGKQSSWLRNVAEKLSSTGAQKVVAGLTMGSQAGGVVMSGVNAGFGFKNASLQKELADWRAQHLEAKKNIDLIEGELDDMKEALLKVLTMAQEGASKLGEILSIDANTSNDILQRVAGQIA